MLTSRLARALAAPALAAALILALAGPANAADTFIESGPEDGALLLPGPVTYTFSAHESGAVFDCSVDNAPFTPCPSGQSATYDLPPGGHIFQVRSNVLGMQDSSPAVRIWTIRNVPCEQAGAAYKKAQGEFFLHHTKLGETKTKLQRAKEKNQAGKVKRLKKKIKGIKKDVAAAQAAMNAALAQAQAVC